MKKNLRKKLMVFLIGVLSFNLNWAQDHGLHFDGIKDYVQWGDPGQGSPGPYAVTPIVDPLVGSDFTIEFWMRSDFADWPGPHGVLFAFNSYNPITHGSNRFIFGIDATGRLYIHDGDNTGLSSWKWAGPTIVTDGECRHIAFTHNFATKECNIYVDGMLEGTVFTTFILDPTDIFSLGQEWDNLDGLHAIEPHAPSQFYYGDMDDIRIWTKIVPVTDLIANKNATFPPGEPDLLGHFEADQGIAGGNNLSELVLENSTVVPAIDGDLVGFTRLSSTSNFVLDPCAPCYASTDTNFIHITENITYDANVFWDNKYYIADEVTVTVSNGAILDITNVDVVFGECAGIVVEENASVRVNNSVLRPCEVDGTWRGITFNAAGMTTTSDNIINESTFKNAEAALLFNGEVDALISSNLFSNCNYGIRVIENPDFKHSISGNRFVTEAYYPNYNETNPACHDFIDNLSSYGIYAEGTQFAQHISHNEFINSNASSLPMVTGISQEQGESIASSNLFTDMLHAFVVIEAMGYTSITNNRIEINYPSSSPVATSNISILIEGTNRPLVEINDNRIINNESQLLTYGAIGLNYSSNISIATNEIEGFDRGITVLQGHNCQITENTITNSGSIGIYFNQLVGAIPSPTHITCNTIKMKDFNGTVGIYIDDMERANEISSNCILDCATSLYLDGPGSLPKIRNNYLYNYTIAGIDARNYSGDIGTGPGDPGMNTLWSNRNTAFDVYALPGPVSVGDNFGMFNLSLFSVTVTSSNPAHSTASCGHQIYESPSQGNLNTQYLCDNKEQMTSGLHLIGQQYELASDYLDQLAANNHPFDFIHNVVGTIRDLDEANLNLMLNSVELSENQEALIKYAFFMKKANYEMAKITINAFYPESEEEEVFKSLRLINLNLMENGYVSLNEDEITFLEDVSYNQGTQANYAIHILNQINDYRDYVFDMPDVTTALKPEGGYDMEYHETYLNIYPNPTTSSVTIELEANEDGDEIQLVNMTGQVIQTLPVNFVVGMTTIDLSELENGLYYIVLTNPETGIKQKEKVIKMAQ